MTESIETLTRELRTAWEQSPYPSFKHTNYFRVYAELFGHLVGKRCTFIETGILNGGSLFMWRRWLGADARIIGLDLNPEASKWNDHGFEIHIGDQGDPGFWRRVLEEIGPFDALLDDGGHQAFQQIVTVREALRAARGKATIAVEDTHTNLMREFAVHGRRSFLEYAQRSTDNLLVKNLDFPGYSFPHLANPESVEEFRFVHSVAFYNGIVAFVVDPESGHPSEMIWNRPQGPATDFRYVGRDQATVEWPNPFRREQVVVRGGKTISTRCSETYRRGVSFIKRRLGHPPRGS